MDDKSRQETTQNYYKYTVFCTTEEGNRDSLVYVVHFTALLVAINSWWI